MANGPSLPKKGKAPSLAAIRKDCDRLLQEINRKEHQHCLLRIAQSCSGQCEVGHHFIPKSVASVLRYNFENIIPLCNACHCLIEARHDPEFDQKIIRIKGQEWYIALQESRKEPNRVSVGHYKIIKQVLHERLAQL